ncbi:FecR domain-containing protein [soil metagenome]
MSENNNKSHGKMDKPEDSWKDEFDEVWNASSHSDPARHYKAPDSAETEDALQEVHIRLGLENRSGRIAGYIQKYSRYLVAAIALLIVGTVLFFAPQTVTAPYGEMAELELRDGTFIELNSGTTVQFNRLYGFTNRTLTLNGEAWFDVSSGKEPFKVYANGTVTEVTGTEFSVRSWSDDLDGETLVTVKTGSVQFFPEGYDENAVSLTAGLKSSWTPERVQPTIPKEADQERMTGWRDRMFIFYEEPLHRIFRDIERRFDLQIDLQNKEVAGETLTGYYRRVESAESLLDDICTVAGLNYSQTANGYRVY